jgi:hypothetical protein
LGRYFVNYERQQMSKKIMQIERTVLTTGALTEAGANASAVEAARRRQAAKRMVSPTA